MSEIGDSKCIQADEGISEQQTTDTVPNDNDDDTSITDHPLQNELVLGVIFDKLPTKNWKSARLVNKTWYSTLQHKWRNEMVYKFQGESEMKDLGWPQVKTITANILQEQHPSNNPNDPLQLGRYPILNIFIHGNYYNYTLFLLGQPRFWELHGQWLKYLHLYFVKNIQKALLKKLLFELTPSLEKFIYICCVCDDMDKSDLNTVKEYTKKAKQQKNLTYLELNTVNTFYDQYVRDGHGYKRQFPISWMELFSAFPNITILKLDIDQVILNTPKNVLKLFETIDIIRKANNNEVLNITELYTNGEPGFGRVDVIANQFLFTSLPISTLELDVRYMRNDDIIAFIGAFKSTLCHLVVYDSNSGDWDEENYLPIDLFPHGLTKLYLGQRCVSSFEFLSYTPNLEELELENIAYMLQPDVCINLAAVTPVVKLKKLHYSLKDTVGFAEMEFLARLMPNVTTCVCNVEAEGFRALCQGWPNLEHLDLGFYFDEGQVDFFLEIFNQLKSVISLKINGNKFRRNLLLEWIPDTDND